MKSNPQRAPRPLNAKDIQRGVLKRLAKYEDLNFFEQYAMFMGMSQLLEGNLKRLLARRSRHTLDATSRWTLGTVARELESSGLRNDFVFLLKSVVTYRNHIAHELLANEFKLAQLLGGKTGRLERRNLEKGIYELEQLMFFHDWTEKHNAWAQP